TPSAAPGRARISTRTRGSRSRHGSCSAASCRSRSCSGAGTSNLAAVHRTILILLACAALAGCGGGGGGSASGPPDALLHPAKLNVKSPQLFTVTVETTKGEFV